MEIDWKKFGVDASDFFANLNTEFASFKNEDIQDGHIHDQIDSHEGISRVHQQYLKAMDFWWESVEKNFHELQ